MNRNYILKFSTFALAAVLMLLGVNNAYAQLGTTGSIQGVVSDESTGEPLIGVTVVATSPVLQGTQSEISDEGGQFTITNLPAGTYEVTFFYSEVKVVRKNIIVGLGRVTPVPVKMSTTAAGGEVITIEEKAPSIDVGSTKQGVTVDKDYSKNVPFPGRNYAGALSAAGGSQNDATGVSFSGSTGMENSYLIDGVNTTGLQFGTLGSPLLNNFIQEMEIITGGYDAEFGRSTGGVVNVVTKSGSNEFHGQVWGNFEPGALESSPAETSVASTAIKGVGKPVYAMDFGFDLGGPIVKDKVWFYVGFAPILNKGETTRIVRTQVDRRKNANNYGVKPDADGNLATTTNAGCEVSNTCEGDNRPDVDLNSGFPIFEEVDRSSFTSSTAQYQFTGKVNFAVTPDHQGAFTFVGSPTTGDGRGIAGTAAATSTHQEDASYDGSFKWTSKFLNNKTQVDTTLGIHREKGVTTPLFDTTAGGAAVSKTPSSTFFLNPNGLTVPDLGVVGRNFDQYENDKVLRYCTDATLPDANVADPFPGIPNCPVTQYSYGSPGGITEETAGRLSGKIDVTERIKAAGHHEIKVGADVERNSFNTARTLTGGRSLDSFADWEVTEYVRLDPMGTSNCRTDEWIGDPADGNPGADGHNDTDNQCNVLDTLTSTGSTMNWSAYAQDKWQILPNLTFKAGLRFEQQYLRNAEEVVGTVNPVDMTVAPKNAIALTNLLAPRIGLLYDWTKEGRSKVYANWGRFYESIPMRINSRSFGGETTYNTSYSIDNNAGLPPEEIVDGDCGAVSGPTGAAPYIPTDGKNCTGGAGAIGSAGTSVIDGIKPQYLDELVFGVEYEVLEDLNVGLSYQRRTLGRVIEDVSADGAQTYMIANPGDVDADVLADLQDSYDNETDMALKEELGRKLNFYKNVDAMDKPRRDYNAVQLTMKKRFSKAFFAQGSYTYSKLEGNFPGLYEYEYAGGQTDPNITFAYDLAEFLANRDGALPVDRPHNAKLDGYYVFDLKDAGAITTGVRFRAQSGVPENALGRHSYYGPNAVMVLPRGSFGRTEFMTNTDLKLAYARKLPKNMELSVYFDILNVFNQQQSANVDGRYTNDRVYSIVDGDKDDLLYLKTRTRLAGGLSAESGSSVNKNLNFGNTTQRFNPLAGRFGVILSF